MGRQQYAGMSHELQQAIERYTRFHGLASGVAATPVDGLFLLRRTSPSELEHAVVRPLLCLVVQGCKQVTIGSSETLYDAGSLMIVTGSVPAASRIATASAIKPYLSMALDLDPVVITDLISDEAAGGPSPGSQDTSADLHDAIRRLVLLMERPESLAVLKGQLIREIHHWLLIGRQGVAVRNLGLPNSHARRIGRAVAILRAEFAHPLPLTRLAAAAGMSRSAFHQHFRAVTLLSPLQFQKHLRLIEARRLILSRAFSLSRVASEVGYESTSHFSREYARMYGRPPAKDRQQAMRWRTGGEVGNERGAKGAAGQDLANAG